MRIVRVTNGWLVLPGDETWRDSLEAHLSRAVFLSEHPVTRGLSEDGLELLLSILNEMVDKRVDSSDTQILPKFLGRAPRNVPNTKAT